MDLDNFVEAQRVLQLTNKAMAELIDVSPSVYCNIRAGRTWKTGVPAKYQAAVNALFERAGVNGHKIEPVTPEVAESETPPAKDDDSDDNPKKETAPTEKADPLKLILETVEIWHAKDGLDEVGFVTVPNGETADGARLVRHYKTRSRGFAKWLRATLYSLGFPAKRDAIKDMIDNLDALCQIRGDEHDAWWRTGWDRVGSLWVDLVVPDNLAVKITPAGWTVEAITKKAPRLVRGDSMGPMPVPTDADLKGLDEWLLDHLNLRPDHDGGHEEGIRNARLTAAFAISAMRPTPPRYHLNLVGEQGSAKTTAARKIKQLADPSEVQDMAPPRSAHDLAVVAAGQRVVSLDNVSKLSPDMSDTLARMATGSTIGGRALFTDHDVAALKVDAAVILNGIPDVVGRSDLAERTLSVKLYRPRHRLLDQEVSLRFTDAAPAITAALMDGLTSVLRNADDVVDELDRERAPRMVDPYVWAEAAGRAWGWPKWALLEYLEANQREAAQDILESDIVALSITGAVELYLRTHKTETRWKGKAGELLTIAQLEKDRQEYRSEYFPQTAKGMATSLRRFAEAMRLVGWKVDYLPADGRGDDKAPRWVLTPPTNATEQ